MSTCVMDDCQNNLFVGGTFTDAIWTLLCILCVVGLSATLDCNICIFETNIDNCNRTKTCQIDQSCYKSVNVSTDGVVYDLGCLDNQLCSSLGAGSLIGRSTTNHCQQCCSTNLCNKDLCLAYTLPTCKDDPLVNCAHLDAQINICSDQLHALTLCRKHCQLCDFADGHWSEWLSWSPCHVTCGNSTQTRLRTCTSPAPAHGGLYCSGDNNETKECGVVEKCPVHGGWSTWNNWGECSSTCDIGIQRRVRTCTHPRPSLFGDHCFGDSSEPKTCNNGPCHDACHGSPCQRGGVCVSNRDIYQCICPTGTSGRHCEYILHPADCEDIVGFNMGFITGVYDLSLPQTHGHKAVFCKMEENGDVWTIFQRRYDGSVDFYRNMNNYTDGFGYVRGEYWLGLEALHQMTSRGTYELKIELVAKNGMQVSEEFGNFWISSGPGYTLHLEHGNGTAGDTSRYGLSHNIGHNFTTFDTPDLSQCGVHMHSGWWFDGCTYANLNGDYNKVTLGMFYHDFRGYESLQATTMMFKRVK